MALINCPECGGTVSDAAKVCPHCGFSLNKQTTSETITPKIVHPRVAKRKVEGTDAPINNYDEDLYEESFFEKYKGFIIIAVILAVCVAAFLIYHGRTSGSALASDTLAVDSAVAAEDCAADTITPYETNSAKEDTDDKFTFANQAWGLCLNGVIGGTDDSRLATWDGDGGFSYPIPSSDNRIRRYIKDVNFDKSNGSLSFTAIDTNTEREVSKFEGTLTLNSDNTVRYQGKFTNHKGVSMDFDLTGELWTSEPEGDWSDAWWY